MGYEMLINWITYVGLTIWAIIALACIWAINFPKGVSDEKSKKD